MLFPLKKNEFENHDILFSLQKRQFKSYGVFREKMNTMNDCPILTMRSQHSGVGGEDFHAFSLKENNPMNIKPPEKDKKIVLNKFNSEYNDILHRKCKSLEDVIDGLLAMEKNTRYSENRLTEEKLLIETRSPNLYTDSKRKQFVDPSSPVFSTEFSLDTPGEFYCDANNDTMLDEFVTCVNCQRCTYLRDARNIYKKCYYCQTWYCSRQCRVNNWNIHTTFCIVGRMADICKRVFKFCNKNLDMQFLLSNVARKGFLTEGRGCVKLTFTDIGSAENFCCFGLSHIQESPNYISWKNFENESQNSYHTLPALCTASKKYNPDLKYILVVSFLIRNGLSVENFSGSSFFKKCAILRLCSFHLHSKPEQEIETSSILILTASPRNVNSFHKEERHARETCFIDIQRKLCERGVDLRHQYPKLYRKLIDFVADGKYFSPAIFHPFDVKMDKCFTCVIIAESEPEIEWLPESNQLNRI